MSAWRLIALGALLSFGTACAALNYPTEGSEAPTPATASPATAEPSEAAASPEAPILLGLGFGESERSLAELEEGGERAWYELTRQAREDRQLGNFDAARERLDQAALQLAGRPAGNAQRRAVHGLRARLALDFAALERMDEAAALADALFEEVEAEPEIGGPATIDLALRFAQIRTAEANEAGLHESQLPLLRIALLASEDGSPSAPRLNLAYQVSQQAMNEGDIQLARRAIDRSLIDARTIYPGDLQQLASINIFRARIFRAAGDLATAEASAIAANRLFDEGGAGSDSRAVGEATLATIVAERGDEDRARAILAAADARLQSEAGLSDHAARTVLGESARVELALGNVEAARDFFVRALDLPGVDFAPDTQLVEELTRELAALDAAEGEGVDAEVDAAAEGEGD